MLVTFFKVRHLSPTSQGCRKPRLTVSNIHRQHRCSHFNIYFNTWIYFWSNSSIRVNSKCLSRQYNNNSFSFYKDWQNQSHMSHISWIKLVCRYCKLCVWKQISVSDVIYNFEAVRIVALWIGVVPRSYCV